MGRREKVLRELVLMSRHLGLPEQGYVILGDGNTSARIDQATFWIKASGAQLHRIPRSGFVQVALAPVLEMLEEKELSDAEIKRGLSQAQVNPKRPHPSIETTLHALALTLGKAKFVGHTHPVALNAILCSVRAREATRGRIFSEEILYGGPAPAFVPYTDPGLPLARRVQRAIERYADRYGEPPRVILLQNHGMIALGQTPAEVQNITAMTVKAARILLGTYALGGPRFLTDRDVQRLSTRPDQLYRRRKANQ
jgi:rhamnose utilization protein RhaD (predicted bifunctional aldolase and dehydrogenase)